MSGFPEDESAWLIEMDGPLYWSGRDGCRAWWSVADAVRFCRWDDADRLRRLMGFEKARVREHVWPRTVMPAVVRPVPSVEPEPPPAPAQAGWTEVAAESIVKMLRPHDGESRHRLNVEEAQGSPMTPDPLEIARAVLRTERTRYVGQPERTDEVLAQALLAKDAEVRALREALDEIACWDEGPEVTGSFDEPGSAKIARAALAQEAGK